MFRKSFLNEKVTSISNQTFHIENIDDDDDDDHHVPSCRIPRVMLQSQQTKPVAAAMGGIKVLPFIPPSYPSQRPFKNSSSAKPRRVASFTLADTELPIDYRQYLRHTDQGVQLYGDEQHRQQQQSTTLEHSLGYFP